MRLLWYSLILNVLRALPALRNIILTLNIQPLHLPSALKYILVKEIILQNEDILKMYDEYKDISLETFLMRRIKRFLEDNHFEIQAHTFEMMRQFGELMNIQKLENEQDKKDITMFDNLVTKEYIGFIEQQTALRTEQSAKLALQANRTIIDYIQNFYFAQSITILNQIYSQIQDEIELQKHPEKLVLTISHQTRLNTKAEEYYMYLQLLSVR